MRKLLPLILVLCTYAAYSQSIVNTEKALPTADKRFAMNTDFTTTSFYGNLDMFRLATGLSVGMKVDTLNTLRIISGITMLHANGEVVKDIGYGQFRHNLILTPKIQLANFYQAQYNNNIIMDNRQLIGSGFRFDLNKDSSNLDFIFFLGAMYEREVLNRDKIPEDEEFRSDLLRSATNFVLKYDKNNFHIVSITYYQVHALDINDFRVLNDTELQIDVNHTLSLNLMFQYRYDSRPPSVLTRHDFMNTLGLTFKIH